LSYGLQWDDGTGGVVWSDIDGYLVNKVATRFTVSGVTPGQVYQFRLQAKNIYGWGSYSLNKQIAAAGIPEQMSIPITASLSTNILVSWIAPSDTSDEIVEYRVYFMARDGDFYETESCVTSADPLPQSCEVPMTVL